MNSRRWFTVSFDDDKNAYADPYVPELELRRVCTDSVQTVRCVNDSYNRIRRQCTCESSPITYGSLTADQRKTVDYLVYLTGAVDFKSALVVIDGGPGCGKSALLTYIVKSMRHAFNKVRILTEKLVNLESHVEQLCEAHVIPHAGLAAERYTDADKLRESVMTCSVSKLLYDVMGESKHDSDATRNRKRVDIEKINSVDAYRSELERLVEFYAYSHRSSKPRLSGAVNLYIIDEYAMISCEKLYFMIGFLIRRNPADVNLFILSGDVDQVEPIGHENISACDANNYDKPWFEIGICGDVGVVYKSLVHGSADKHVFEKFVLSEPARCVEDAETTEFIKTYKNSTDKQYLMDGFVQSLDNANGSDVILMRRECVDAYLSGSKPTIDLGMKIIVRQNSEIQRISDHIFSEFHRLYPSLIATTLDNNLVTGMTYVLMKTLDSKKVLCNRSVVVLKSVNMTRVGEIDTITVYKVNDPMSREYTIGPVYNEGARPWFPLQLACVENSFQIQGMTIDCDMFLDFYNCGMQHRYVMLTRVRSKNQIKSIINIK